MTKLKTIDTEKVPEAIGPYSQTRKAGNLVFCSGQIGIDPSTGKIVGQIRKQTERVLKNLSLILKEEGLGLKDVVKTTVYLTNIADFPMVNEIYARYFFENKPARATVAVAALPKGVLIEIEAVALRKK